MLEPWVLGKDAKLYYGAPESNPTTEMKNVRDLTLKLSAGEADVTTRDNEGWRATATTLRECSVEFETVWKPDDAAFQAIRTAYLASGRIALKILLKSDGEGMWGDFTISGFDLTQPLEDAIKAKVEAKLAKFGGWVVGT